MSNRTTENNKKKKTKEINRFIRPHVPIQTDRLQLPNGLVLGFK
jgi:hypothetical protein